MGSSIMWLAEYEASVCRAARLVMKTWVEISEASGFL